MRCYHFASSEGKLSTRSTRQADLLLSRSYLEGCDVKHEEHLAAHSRLELVNFGLNAQDIASI